MTRSYSIILLAVLLLRPLEADEPVRLRFRTPAAVTGQVVRLGDLVEVAAGQSSQTDELLQVPLAPAPREGISQTWTSEDVLQHLELRGLHRAAIRWEGSSQTVLSRQTTVTQLTSYNGSRSDPQSIAISTTAIPMKPLSPAFVQERAVKQAETLLRQAITEYITLQSGERTEWQINLSVPVQFAQSLQVRSNIVSIGGGASPWEGEQEFVFDIKDAGKLTRIKVPAKLELPPMVVVASRTLRRDEVLSKECLTYAPKPRRTTDQSGNYFTNVDDLIGKQLRRSVSTGVPLEQQYIGEPVVISRGELVEIESIAGNIVVKTSGRSIESGAVGDLISVELVPSKERILAMVTAPMRVRITTASDNN